MSVNLKVCTNVFSGYKITFSWRSHALVETGRGMKALVQVHPGDTIVDIPYELLITQSTVTELIPCSELSEHQALTLFLSCLKEGILPVGQWGLYMNSLPRTFDTVALQMPLWIIENLPRDVQGRPIGNRLLILFTTTCK